MIMLVAPDVRWIRGASRAWRVVLAAFVASLFAACASVTGEPGTASSAVTTLDPGQAERNYLDRAARLTMTREQVTVTRVRHLRSDFTGFRQAAFNEFKQLALPIRSFL